MPAMYGVPADLPLQPFVADATAERLLSPEASDAFLRWLEAEPALLDDRYLMDTAGPDETSPLGTTAGEVLDWLWRTRIEPMSS